MTLTEWLLLLILLLEVARWIHSITQDLHVRSMNAAARKRQEEWQEMCEQHEEDMRKIHREELQIVADGARGCQILADLVREIERAKPIGLKGE